jgi:hypothetical protein
MKPRFIDPVLGDVPQARQAEIMRKLSEPKPPEDEVWKQIKKLVASRG